MTLILLGASGFIGSKVHQTLMEKKIEFLTLDRNFKLHSSPSQDSKIEYKNNLGANKSKLNQKITVINLAGNALGSNEQIFNANYTYQLEVLTRLLDKKVNIKWIQSSSYFQNYYKLHGIHKNYYAECKYMFLKELQLVASREKLEVINLVMPHITGIGEQERRLIPQIIKAKINHQPVLLSSRFPVLPLLPVQIFTNHIIEIIQSDKPEERSTIAPMINLTVEEIAEIILNDNFDLARFGEVPNRDNEFLSDSELGLPNAYGSLEAIVKIFNEIECGLRQNSP